MEEYSYLIHSAKGTSWKNHKYLKKIGDRYYYTKEQLSQKIRSSDLSNEYGTYILNGVKTGKDKNKDGYEDEVGIIYQNKKRRDIPDEHKIGIYDTSNDKWWDSGEDASKINKKLGPVSVEYAEDGVEYNLDLDYGKKTVKSVSEKAVSIGENAVKSSKKLLNKIIKK